MQFPAELGEPFGIAGGVGFEKLSSERVCSFSCQQQAHLDSLRPTGVGAELMGVANPCGGAWGRYST